MKLILNHIFKFVVVFVLFFISLSCLGQILQSKTTSDLNLMPWPKEIKMGNGQFTITPDFSIEVNQKPSKRIEIATTKFLRRLSERTGVFLKNGFAFYNSKTNNPLLIINYNRIGKLQINEDESYQLIITPTKILINATTDIGVIYALETLLQTTDSTQNSFYFPELSINDAPRFTWRGLMIDAARHFMPVDVIKRNLDAMASVKMNVFHWHLSDDQGFRFESKTHPELQQLASDGLYYTQNQIKDIVTYASDRGIRVIPEIDVPGHATAILTAFPEIASKDTTYTLERNSGIFNPTLDPTNEKTYKILGDLFSEMANLFPDNYFHIGGDENEGKDWDANKKIQEFKKEHHLKTNHDLQTYFNIRLEKMLAKHGKRLMGWEEIMTSNMPTSALIHAWKGSNEGQPAGQSLIDAAKKGYNTILSNGYYLDLMLPASSHYLVDPFPKNSKLTPEEAKRILGGEATMWSELVTPLTIDSRIWPRAAAIAERFWSPSTVNDVSFMYKRLPIINFRLEELGCTQIKNKEVILRNISNNQSTESLQQLTDIFEPVKVYTRNENGTEYKTFSPFTLLADACTADAPDGLILSNLTENYLVSHSEETKEQLLKLFYKWGNNYNLFLRINERNPILNNIEPISKNLSEISNLLIELLTTNNVKSIKKQVIINQFNELKKPRLDVEFSSINSIKKLIEDSYQKNNSKIDLNTNSNQP